MGKTLTRSMTYDELTAEIAAGTLNKGEKITITDFATTHYMIDATDAIIYDTESNPVVNTGQVEPITVTALNNNTLAKTATSTLFPRDIIHYEWDPAILQGDESFYLSGTGALVPNFKGCITFRHDTVKNISVHNDFRNIIYRRWKLDFPVWNAATTYTRKHQFGNSLVKTFVIHEGNVYLNVYDGNNIGITPGTDSSAWFQVLDSETSSLYWFWQQSGGSPFGWNITANTSEFVDMLTFPDYEGVSNIKIGRRNIDSKDSGGTMLNNIVVKSDSTANNKIDNIDIADDCFGMSFMRRAERVKIGANSALLVFGQVFNVSMGISTRQTSFLNYSYHEVSHVTIGDGTESSLLFNCTYLDIGSGCNGIVLSGYCGSLSFGSGSQRIFVLGYSWYLNIGAGVYDVFIGDDNWGVSITEGGEISLGSGDSAIHIIAYKDIKIKDDCEGVEIGAYCDRIEVGSGSYYVRIGPGSANITLLKAARCVITGSSNLSFSTEIKKCHFNNVIGPYNPLFDWSDCAPIFADYPVEITTAGDGSFVMKYIPDVTTGMVIEECTEPV